MLIEYFTYDELKELKAKVIQQHLEKVEEEDGDEKYLPECDCEWTGQISSVSLWKSLWYLIDEAKVCLTVCVSVQLIIIIMNFNRRNSHGSHGSKRRKTINVIIIKLSVPTVTASYMRMHHVLIILTLTFIQGHTYLDHENNKCSIISEATWSNSHQDCPTKGRYKNVSVR